MNLKRKIICPGVSKTGTISLTKALQRFHYNILHYPHLERMVQESLIDGNGPIRTIANYDGISDLPAAIWWLQLLDAYPNSLVIMTVRDPVKWIKSMRNHYERNQCVGRNIDVHHLLRIAMYGFAGWNKTRLLQRYFEHWRQVHEAYYRLGGRMLWLSMDEQDDKEKWGKLGEFLQRNSETKEQLELVLATWSGYTEFPRENVTKECKLV